jgi:hypothetical protein
MKRVKVTYRKENKREKWKGRKPMTDAKENYNSDIYFT